MRGLKTAISIMMFLSLGTAASPQNEPGPAKTEPGSSQEKTTAAKEDDRLPIYKEGWQFFLAP
jgi:hypothetical protein